MKEIIPLRIVLDFELFQKEKIIISLFLSSLLVFIYFLFIKIKLNYQKEKVDRDNIIECKNKFIMLISGLNIDSNTFFYDINYLLRSFLENYKVFTGITKMTKNEILLNNIKSNDLKYLLDSCEKYEFGNISDISDDEKLDIKNNALKIIKNI